MKKRMLKSVESRKNVDELTLEKYTKILSEMIDCKTVFTDDFKYQNEFKKFYKVIENNFPEIVKHSEKLSFGSGCFLYFIKGKNATKNIMLMSHHDVVDGTKGWETDAFKATIKDGKLFGRGTVDTKSSLFGILEATEELLKEGFEFNNFNLYIASSNNEETAGDGMVEVAKYFKVNNINLDLVLDEGGAITTKMLPGYDGKSAMVAVHEKGRFMYKCSVKMEEKGHVSLSPSDIEDPVVSLSKFITEVNETKIFKAKFYSEVEATFRRHAPYMNFPMNFVFKNLTLFSPLVKKIMMEIKEAKPMLSTSVSFTNFFAGDKNHIQSRAKEANATMYFRCVREEDLIEGMKTITKIAKKHNVSIDLIERDYCKPSKFDTKEYKILEKVLNTNFPDIVVAPFLLTAGTDARRLTDVASNILRFTPVDLSPEQFKSIHGDNEHIYVKNIGQCVLFYKDFLKQVGEIYE